MEDTTDVLAHFTRPAELAFEHARHPWNAPIANTREMFELAFAIEGGGLALIAELEH